jgi:hypothetical protein
MGPAQMKRRGRREMRIGKDTTAGGVTRIFEAISQRESGRTCQPPRF